MLFSFGLLMIKLNALKTDANANNDADDGAAADENDDVDTSARFASCFCWGPALKMNLVALLFCYSYVLFFCACKAAAHAVVPCWTLLPGFVSVRVGAGMDDDAVKMRHMLT